MQSQKEMPKRSSLDGNILGGGLSEYLVIPAWQIIVCHMMDMRHAALTAFWHAVFTVYVKARLSLVIRSLSVWYYGVLP